MIAPGLNVVVQKSFLHEAPLEPDSDNAFFYSRRIFLTAPDSAPHGLAGRCVAHAILHTDLNRLPPAVRDGVRSEKVMPSPRRASCCVLRAVSVRFSTANRTQHWIAYPTFSAST